LFLLLFTLFDYDDDDAAVAIRNFSVDIQLYGNSYWNIELRNFFKENDEIEVVNLAILKWKNFLWILDRFVIKIDVTGDYV